MFKSWKKCNFARWVILTCGLSSVGQFFVNCAQLLCPLPKFLTAFSGEKRQIFMDIYGFIKPNIQVKSWAKGTRVGRTYKKLALVELCLGIKSRAHFFNKLFLFGNDEKGKGECAMLTLHTHPFQNVLTLSYVGTPSAIFYYKDPNIKHF